MIYNKKDLKVILDQLTLDQQERLFELCFQGNPNEMDFSDLSDFQANDMVIFFIRHKLTGGLLEGESIQNIKLPWTKKSSFSEFLPGSNYRGKSKT